MDHESERREEDALPGVRAGRPWGFWATIGFSAIVMVAFFTVQVGITFAVIRWHGFGRRGLPDALQAAASNGFLITIATLTSAPLCTGLIVLFARLRKGLSVREYLGLRDPLRRDTLAWLLALAALLASSETLQQALGRPIVPPWMVDAYTTAVFVPAFILAIVLVAPLFEELFFRGFLFQGIHRSRLGPAGALGLTSLLWALVHLQYDAFDIAQIFVLGLFLGAARLKTGSTYLALLMHSLTNLVATVEVQLAIHVAG